MHLWHNHSIKQWLEEEEIQDNLSLKTKATFNAENKLFRILTKSQRDLERGHRFNKYSPGKDY